MIQLASVFQSGMLLQRDKPVAIWGTAEPGESVRVCAAGGEWSGLADEEGRWSLSIGPLPAAESCSLRVSGADREIKLQDVAVGDVYLAGGQSNMEFLMRYEKFFEQERETCHDPSLRFFDVPEIAYDGQDRDFDYSKVGVWRRASREDLDYFSAPAYYFAKELRRELGVPVGIIGLNWGGTRTSAWMREDHARQICPEQVAAFEAKLGGRTFEELTAEAGKSPLNDRGYSVWEPFEEFIMRGTPGPEEIGAFFARMAESFDVASFASIADPKEYPGTLYEHMVKRVAPYGVKGALWYQGESDDEIDGSAAHYALSLRTMIGDWRELWGEELPFFVVQLPGFRSWLQVVDRDYPLIRQAQQEVADADEKVFLCSISDLGEEFDIHPKNKRDVGKRLALLALRYLYGKDILADPPRPDSVSREGDRVTIRFTNAGEGLHIAGESLEALSVRSAGGELSYRAEAAGDRLSLTVPGAGDRPLELRFAKELWYCVNLYNSAGLPAIPFTLGC